VQKQVVEYLFVLRRCSDEEFSGIFEIQCGVRVQSFKPGSFLKMH
jgi:hypothetical protein